MPSKKKFKKNRKMKGGNQEEPILAQVVDSNDNTNADTAEVVAVDNKNIAGGSSYVKFSDDIYINVIMMIGLGGVIWMMISRTIIRHKYSEVVAYGLIGVAVTFSCLLILFKGVRGITPSNSILGAIKNTLYVTKYILKRCSPALLILTQIGVLCYIMYNNADYIFSSPNIPYMFQVFNVITMAMILAQCVVWKDKVIQIMSNITSKKYNPMTVPGFILASILSGIAISQLYVILEYLRTDC